MESREAAAGLIDVCKQMFYGLFDLVGGARRVGFNRNLKFYLKVSATDISSDPIEGHAIINPPVWCSKWVKSNETCVVPTFQSHKVLQELRGN